MKINKNMLGIVLAGGKSSRMGKDKATLEINGIQQCIWLQERLHAFGINNVLISSNHIVNAIPDKYPDRGPLSGIFSVLSNLDSLPDMALIVPTDMPLISQHHITTLINLINENTECVSTAHSRFPIVFRPSLSLLDHIEAILSNGDQRSLSLRQLLAFFGDKHQVIVGNETELLSANTPEQWAKIEQIVAKGYYEKHGKPDTK